MDLSNVDTIADLSDDLRWGLLQKKAQEWKLRRVFTLFREQGIEPVLIKGWAAGIYYPQSHFRYSIDIDLAVSAEDFAAASETARSVISEGLAIDLHRELRHHDTVDWKELFENSVMHEIDGYPIRILRVEDHLRVLCVHWLTDGGANKERLWDIYYIVKYSGDDFDWDRFLGSVSPRRRRWLVCTLGIAAKYLGLDLSHTPIAAEAAQLPRWLINTLEREWESETKLLPLEAAMFDPKKLFKQIGKRIRLNPIRATIEMEGNFDARTRIFYRIGSIVKGIGPSYGRITGMIKQRLK